MGVATFTFQVGMKIEKSPSAHVWNHRVRLKHRAMLPFVSEDRYDHKQACKHTQWVPVSSREVFHDSPSDCYSSKLIPLPIQMTLWEDRIDFKKSFFAKYI